MAGRRGGAGSDPGWHGACGKGDVKEGPGPPKHDADGDMNLASKSTDPCFSSAAHT